MRDFVGDCPHCGALNELVSDGADLAIVHCSGCRKPLGPLYKLRELVDARQERPDVRRASD